VTIFIINAIGIFPDEGVTEYVTVCNTEGFINSFDKVSPAAVEGRSRDISFAVVPQFCAEDM
jgi:hypothetical protein